MPKDRPSTPEELERAVTFLQMQVASMRQLLQLMLVAIANKYEAPEQVFMGLEAIITAVMRDEADPGHYDSMRIDMIKLVQTARDIRRNQFILQEFGN